MENNTNGSHYLTAIIVLVVILGVGYYVWPKSPDVETKSESYSTDTNQANAVASTPSPSISATPAITNESVKNNMHTVTIETNKGTIVFETYDADAPRAAKNFVDLANKGFYNGVIFHRVIKGFMIQGGDPTGTGRGGPGYSFEDELDPSTASAKEGYRRGVVAMANAGPNTNGSQFFIMHADYPLPHNYTIFGKVVKGIEIVDAIANSPVDANDKPTEKIVMNKVTVTDKK
jgi:cyclophilin family peptidyl-prolyl cis-trans isomerase